MNDAEASLIGGLAGGSGGSSEITKKPVANPQATDAQPDQITEIISIVNIVSAVFILLQQWIYNELFS